MRVAAQAFVGMRDFRSFTPDGEDPGGRDRSTVVLVERVDIAEDGDVIVIGIEGSHFIWKMVRRIVGVLAEIGRGGLEPEAAADLLAADSKTPARLTAPPSGLFLERVLYEGDPQTPERRVLTPVVKIDSL